jgi:toxin ParE1/3/4
MKLKSVVTRRRADEDIDRAFEYYLLEAGPELAVAFIDELERSITHLSRFPLSGSTRLEYTLAIPGMRVWPLQRFPFLIIYFDTERFVEIWRVLQSQNDIPASIRNEE